MKLDMINATKTDSVTENLVTQTEKTGLNTHQRNTAKNTRRPQLEKREDRKSVV